MLDTRRAVAPHLVHVKESEVRVNHSTPLIVFTPSRSATHTLILLTLYVEDPQHFHLHALNEVLHPP